MRILGDEKPLLVLVMNDFDLPSVDSGFIDKRKGFVFRKIERRDEGLVKHIVLSTNIQLRSKYYLTPQALALRRDTPMIFESWVGEHDGRVFGMVELAISGTALYVKNLRIDVPLQSCGYGSRMLLDVSQFARDQGCTEIVLYTVVGTGSPEFFAKNGFSEQEIVVSDIFTAPSGEPVYEMKMLKTV